MPPHTPSLSSPIQLFYAKASVYQEMVEYGFQKRDSSTPLQHTTAGTATSFRETLAASEECAKTLGIGLEVLLTAPVSVIVSL